MQLLVILCTFPDAAAARAAGETVVNEGLAACVNILPAVESIYRWEGKVETGSEVLAVMKTPDTHWPALEKRLSEIHPYQVPEIVALSAAEVAQSYLQWAVESVAGIQSSTDDGGERRYDVS